MIVAKLFAVATTVTFVTLNSDPTTNKVGISRKVTTTKGDIGKHFPMKDGQPVFGSRVFRELTYKEIVAKGLAENVKAAKKLRETHYLSTVEQVVRVIEETKAA
jgi:hypothetical protein